MTEIINPPSWKARRFSYAHMGCMTAPGAGWLADPAQRSRCRHPVPDAITLARQFVPLPDAIDYPPKPLRSNAAERFLTRWIPALCTWRKKHFPG